LDGAVGGGSAKAAQSSWFALLRASVRSCCGCGNGRRTRNGGKPMKICLAVAAVVASAAPAFAAPCCGVYHPGTASARDQLLATPAPYPSNRVDSPDRVQNGRVWVSGERYGGAATRYGADRYDHRGVIYARRDHKVVALNPWCDVRGASRIGFDDLEQARNQWLREQGYVLRVRTHVNPARFVEADEKAAGDLPEPRATIKRVKQVRTPEKPVAYVGATTTDEIRERLANESAIADAR